MNTLKKLLVGLWLLSAGFAFGQNNAGSKGRVIILQDTSVTQLMKRNLAWNESKLSMTGYRIQIYFGTDRTKANDTRTLFIKDHPETEAYLLYHQPNFKVRVGDYKTRLEALNAFQIIGFSFPGSFIVKDEVKLPKPE